MINLSNIRRLAAGGLLASVALLGAQSAQALPSYSRQTGVSCDTCHVGSFGPELTPFGQRFKIRGYVDGGNSSVPLSAMIVGNLTHTAEGQPDKPPGFNHNDNAAVQEVSAFLAGRLTTHLGSFAQVTYSGVDHSTAWDNLDVRYAQEFKPQDHDLVLGVSVNNNPGVQDPFNNLPAWSFPYTTPDLAPSPATGPLLAGGLAQQVLGSSLYGFLDDHWYGEMGGYHSLDRHTLRDLRMEDIVRTAGVSPYLRVGYLNDLGSHAYNLGLVAMQGRLELPGVVSSDRYRDVGVTATYQYFGTRKNMFTANALALREWQHLGASTTLGDAQHQGLGLNSYSLDLSYFRDQTYGFTAGFFDTQGSRDQLAYADNRLQRPDSRGEIVQIDYTPFGKYGSWMAPNVNVRLGLQYTHYDRFDGASSNYDGTGRSASDNDTLMAFVWGAF
jgi:hypothetical protein